MTKKRIHEPSLVQNGSLLKDRDRTPGQRELLHEDLEDLEDLEDWELGERRERSQKNFRMLRRTNLQYI